MPSTPWGMTPDGNVIPPRPGITGWLRATVGGWIGAALSRDTPYETAIEKEKARSGPAGIVLPWFEPYIDNYCDQTPQMFRAYRKMWADANCKTGIMDKVLSVASLDFHAEPDGIGPKAKKVAEFVKWNMTRRLVGGVRELVENICWGMLIDGYSVNAKNYQLQDRGDYAGKYALHCLKPKDVSNDVILKTDPYRNVVSVMGLRYNAGEEFDPALFVITKYLSLYGSPVGTSDFLACYRPWWLLRTCWTLRTLGLERRAFPLLVGLYKGAQQQPSLGAALTRAKLAGWVTAPEGVKIEAISMSGGSQDEFSNAIKDLKHEIFLALLGSILANLEGSVPGGAGDTSEHRSTADQWKWHISAIVRDATNSQIVPDLVDLNFVGAGYPYCTLSAVDEKEQQAGLTIDTGLHQLGVDLSKKELRERYGRADPLDAEDTVKGATAAPPGQGPPGQGGQPPTPEGLQFDDHEPPAGATTTYAETGAEVPAASPFRFSEAWGEYVRGRAA